MYGYNNLQNIIIQTFQFNIFPFHVMKVTEYYKRESEFAKPICTVTYVGPSCY